MKQSDILKQEPTIYLTKKMWKFAGKERKWIVLYTILFLFSNILMLVHPVIFGRLLDEIQNNGVGDNINTIMGIMFMWLFIQLLFWAFHGPARIIENIVSFKIMQNYKEYLLTNILKLNISWHTDRDSGEIIDKVSKATSSLMTFAGATFVSINILVSIIGTSIALALFHPLLALMVPVFIFFGFFVIRQFDKELVKKYFKLNKFYNKTSGRVFDTISNITSIKALHIENHTFKRIKKLMWRPLKLYRKGVIQNESKWFSASFVVTVLTLISMTLYLFFVRDNLDIVSLGSIGIVYIYLTQLGSVVDGFAWRYGTIVRERTDVANVEDIEEAFVDTEVSVNSLPEWKEISLTNILFRYKDSKQKKQHLELDFSFSKNQKIALIGESGSGKTTFLKVLHGMYPDSSAMLKIGDNYKKETNFVDIDLKSTLVPQEPEIFSSSIRENITLGVEVSDEDILKVIELAKFKDVLDRLPKGLESVINEKGVNLSGGEKQRLALVRALFFSDNKEVVLLDESTSSVDAETEVKIYQNIFKHFDDATIIASIHKMNLLKYFDRIVIFEEGKVVDEGDFDELLERNSKFKKNWEEYIAKPRFINEVHHLS